MLLPNDLHQYPLPTSTIELVIEDVLPRAEVQLAVGDGNDDFAAHHLTFVVGVSIVFPSAVVQVTTRCRIAARIKRGQLFQPTLVISVQTRFVVVDEDGCGYVHRVYQYETVGNATLCDKPLNVVVDRDNRTAFGDFHPEFFRECFHATILRLRTSNSKNAFGECGRNQQLEPIDQYGDRPTGRKAEFPAAFPFVFIRGPLKGNGHDRAKKSIRQTHG